MTLTYTIRFLDYWHLSSGLSAGARLDSTVVKDSDGLPYAPGKTLKGLFREMAEFHEDKEFISKCFGTEGTNQGVCYFSNAVLNPHEAKEIIAHKLQNHLYDVIASTKIGEKNNPKETEGIAVDNSLREIEVVVPLTLYGTIQNIPNEYTTTMQQSIEMLKRMGLNRTRGLGRCEIKGELS